MNWNFDKLRAELEKQLDLDSIREREYRAVLREQIVNEVRRQARQEAEEEIARLHMLNRISR